MRRSHSDAGRRRSPSRRSIRTTASVSLLVAGSLVLSACTGTSIATTTNGTAKTLTIAIGASPGALDYTTLGSAGTSVQPLQALWDSLLRIEPDGTIVPHAAKSFSYNSDYTKLTLTLRQDMKFNDGTPIDSAVVLSSLQHFQKSTGPEAANLAGITFAAPDKWTVVLTAPKPDRSLSYYMAEAAGAIANPKTLSNKMAPGEGSGPYLVDTAKTTSGSTYTLVRNKNYWDKQDFPYNQVVFKVFTDETAALSALRTNQINATFVSQQGEPNVANGNFNLVQTETEWAGLILFDRTGKVVPAMKDVRVRQAINMAFDRSAIIKALFPAGGTPTTQTFNPKDPLAYDTSLDSKYPDDLTKAKQLMADAGYADGFSMSLPKVPGFDQANPLIIQQLGKLNIKVTEKAVPLASFYTDILGGKYPIFFFTMGTTTAPLDVDGWIKSTSIWNPGHSGSSELDALIAQGQTASGADAKKIYTEINQYVVDQAWFAPWAFIKDTWAFTKDTTATPASGNIAPYLYTFKPAA